MRLQVADVSSVLLSTGFLPDSAFDVGDQLASGEPALDEELVSHEFLGSFCPAGDDFPDQVRPLDAVLTDVHDGLDRRISDSQLGEVLDEAVPSKAGEVLG